MKVGIISFTGNGERLAGRVEEALAGQGDLCFRTAWEKGMDLKDWTGAAFASREALVFVGAVGIAVRAVAPYLKDKLTDPAVVAMDEAGRFVIPLVSGHAGGANRLAVRIGEAIGAVPVITTATDVNGLFAVDVFAKDHGMALSDRKLAKEVSAALLRGEPVGWLCQWGDLPAPEGFVEGRGERLTVRIGLSGRREPGILCLIPKAVTLGIGCKRGTKPEALEEAVFGELSRLDVSPLAVERIATIDVKQDEPGLRALAEKEGWPLCCYSAGELEAVPGDFSRSRFVYETVGTGNVCERAAALGGRRLISGKRSLGGITLAVSVREPKTVDRDGISI